MKRLLCMMLVLSSISVFSQKEMKVVSFKQSTSDISARTNQREDTKGEACALVKVQLPIRNALFDGDIIGEIAYKTNEYWVYMPQNSSQLVIKLQNCTPLKVEFNKFGIPYLESKGTYELCALKEEAGAPQLYNEGMSALAQNDIVTAFEKLEKASDAGYAPAAFELGQASLIPYDMNYDDNPNTTESYQEAYNYYKKASEGGSPEAQYALGVMLLNYQNGYPVELSKLKVDPAYLEKSVIWGLIRSAADKGVVDAQYHMLSDDKWCDENAKKNNAIAEFGMGLRFDEELSSEEYFILESLDINRTEDSNVAFSWYQKAANHGLDVAQWRLGEMYARGMGVESNINKAIEWRTKAAEQGNYLYQFMMGLMYSYGGFSDYSTYVYPDGYNFRLDIPIDAVKAEYWMRKLNHKELSKTERERIEGNGVYSASIDELASLLKNKKEFDKAIYWYQREIEMGYRDAYCNLGQIYLEGTGVSKDYQKARKLFESAILDDEHYGDGYSGQLKDNALCYLGIIYRDGLGVEVDRAKALIYLMQSTHNGYGPTISFYELGNLYFAENKYEEALKYYREASSYVDKYYGKMARYKLGLMYLNGLGVEYDKNKAIHYLGEAAYGGIQEAKTKLKELGLPENYGEILHNYELGKDKYDHSHYDEAIKMFRLSAEQGYAPAQYYMGKSYDKGRGVSENKAEAAKWYRLAAEQDHTEAQFNLGYAYLMGEGVSVDYSEGVKWTRLAAEKGYRSAQDNMGWCYENGKGVPKNYSEAVRWYKLAAKQNSSYAIKQLKRLNEM